MSHQVIECEVLIVGGGLGGVAAALSACEAGRKVVMTEETDWGRWPDDGSGGSAG